MAKTCPFIGSECIKAECALWMEQHSLCAKKYAALSLNSILQNTANIKKETEDISQDIRYIHDSYCGPIVRDEI